MTGTWKGHDYRCFKATVYPDSEVATAWMYENNSPKKPGFEEILIAPKVSNLLTNAKAEYQSVKGKIVSSWQLEDKLFKLQVQTPGIPTEIILPDGSTYEQTEEFGEYSCTL